MKFVQQVYLGSHTSNHDEDPFKNHDFKLPPETRSRILEKVSQGINSIMIKQSPDKRMVFDKCIESAILLAKSLHADVFIETTGDDEDNPEYGLITFQSALYLFYQMKKNHNIKNNLKQMIDLADELIIESSEIGTRDNDAPNDQLMTKLSFVFELFDTCVQD